MNKLPTLKQPDFVKRVWDDLTSIDLSGYTKTLKHAGNATYLPWAAAWTLLMQRYPHSTEDFTVLTMDNKSVEVRCTLTVSDGVDEFTRTMFLPVMNQKNEAIFDPSARAISDAKQRCLVKCLGKFGLGLHLYTGDEFPKLENAPNIPHGNITDEQADDITTRLADTKADVAAFLKFFNIEEIDELPAAKYKNAVALLDAKKKKVAA